MSSNFRYLLAICGTLFVLFVFNLLLKRKLSEKDSLLWIFGCIIIFIMSLNPDILDNIAWGIGVDYPPALLFLFAILILLFVILINTINISKLRSEVKELTQHIAINEEKYEGEVKDSEYIKNSCK